MTKQERIDRFRLTIGKNIQYYRESQMTLEELAEYTNLDEKNLNKIENGHSTPRADTLVKVAEVLNVDSAELLKGTKGILEIVPEKDRIKKTKKVKKTRKKK